MKIRKGHEWPAILASVFLVVPVSLYRAWLLSFMWAWFILPFGLAVPSVWVLAGLLFVVSFVLGVRRDGDPKEYEWPEAIGKVVSNGFVFFVTHLRFRLVPRSARGAAMRFSRHQFAAHHCGPNQVVAFSPRYIGDLFPFVVRGLDRGSNSG